MIGSKDQNLLLRAAPLLRHDPELGVAAQAVVMDGLLYHDLFSDDLYNGVLNRLVPLLPSTRCLSEIKDYQIHCHDAWRKLPRRSLLRTYWGYLTHGRCLFDHPLEPGTTERYGYLTRDELPQFLHLAEREAERIPWYFFKQTVDALRRTREQGQDLYCSVQIRGRRYRLLR